MKIYTPSYVAYLQLGRGREKQQTWDIYIYRNVPIYWNERERERDMYLPIRMREKESGKGARVRERETEREKDDKMLLDM